MPVGLAKELAQGHQLAGGSAVASTKTGSIVQICNFLTLVAKKFVSKNNSGKLIHVLKIEIVIQVKSVGEGKGLADAVCIPSRLAAVGEGKGLADAVCIPSRLAAIGGLSN